MLCQSPRWALTLLLRYDEITHFYRPIFVYAICRTRVTAKQPKQILRKSVMFRPQRCHRSLRRTLLDFYRRPHLFCGNNGSVTRRPATRGPARGTSHKRRSSTRRNR
eukprot:scaffold2992_cov214-Amphora_coffeaeformis.AAC.45